VAPPGVVVDTDGLTLTYSKVKTRRGGVGGGVGDSTAPRLRIELVGTLLHSKIIVRQA